MNEEERQRVRREAKFPKGGIELSDFTFRLQPYAIDPKTRVAFLESHETGALRPQPFRAMTDLLRRRGEDSEANALEIEWRRRAVLESRPKVPNTHPPRSVSWYRCPGYWLNRGWSAALRWTVGYGFRPARVLYWAVGLIALMAAILVWAPQDAFYNMPEPGLAVAVLSATQAFLPLVQLGRLAELNTTSTTVGILVGYAQAIVSLAGWILAAVFIAGVSGVVKKAGP